MAEAFFDLSRSDRTAALAQAAATSGRPDNILEKDIWVVWTLRSLFDSPFGKHLCFKGGTSLSKAYGIIERFSEDLDLTYDVRQILEDDLQEATADPLPSSRSQANKWAKLTKKRLQGWVEEVARPHIELCLADINVPVRLEVKPDQIALTYEDAAHTKTDYLASRILIEFGARSTGEPMRVMDIACDAAIHLPMLEFPMASPRVMAAERTFWEKVTAAHAFCMEERLRGDRFARHWYDIVKLDAAGIAASALGEVDLGRAVARHKNFFFSVKGRDGKRVDYLDAVSGGLHLVPTDGLRAILQDDYTRMVEAGLLEGSAPSFDEIMDWCERIERQANGLLAPG